MIKVEESATAIATWFNELIAALRAHELQLTTQTAPQDMQAFYKKLMSENTTEIAHSNKQHASKLFISQMLEQYVQEIAPLIKADKLKQLALSHNDAELLVWVEVVEGDEATERELILAKARVNALFHTKGYDVQQTIVESADKLPVPAHYKAVTFRVA